VSRHVEFVWAPFSYLFIERERDFNLKRILTLTKEDKNVDMALLSSILGARGRIPPAL